MTQTDNKEKEVLDEIFQRIENQLNRKETELKFLIDKQEEESVFTSMHSYFSGAISTIENHISFLKTILQIKDIYDNQKQIIKN